MCMTTQVGWTCCQSDASASKCMSTVWCKVAGSAHAHVLKYIVAAYMLLVHSGTNFILVCGSMMRPHSLSVAWTTYMFLKHISSKYMFYVGTNYSILFYSGRNPFKETILYSTNSNSKTNFGHPAQSHSFLLERS